MKNRPLGDKEIWKDGWTHERIIRAMLRGGLTVGAYSFRYTTMRGSRDIDVTLANFPKRPWSSEEWVDFTSRNNLIVTKGGDGLAVISERQTNDQQA